MDETFNYFLNTGNLAQMLYVGNVYIVLQGSMDKASFVGERYYGRAPDYYKISAVDSLPDLAKFCLGEMVLTCVMASVFLRLFPLRPGGFLATSQEEARDIYHRKFVHAIFVGLVMVALSVTTWVCFDGIKSLADVELYMISRNE